MAHPNEFTQAVITWWQNEGFDNYRGYRNMTYDQIVFKEITEVPKQQTHKDTVIKHLADFMQVNELTKQPATTMDAAISKAIQRKIEWEKLAEHLIDIAEKRIEREMENIDAVTVTEMVHMESESREKITRLVRLHAHRLKMEAQKYGS